MPEQPTQLPMVTMRDPEALAEESAHLAALEQGPLGAKLWGFTKLSGPGWLQSAFTLGGGSLGSSLVAGSLMGYAILWVQPLAMACGVIMLSAVAYQTLSTRMRPFEAVRVHVHPAMAWGWALASLLSSMIWCLPQYSLAVSVVSDMSGVPWKGTWSLVPSGVILVVVAFVTLNYNRKGIRIYETVIKLMVAVILVSFGLVVIRTGVDWAKLFAGFLGFHLPFPGRVYPAFLESAQQLSEAARTYGQPDPNYMQRIGQEGFDAAVAAFATAVGINMTFLFPYSLQARGWTRQHRGLAQFDLWTGMLIPFVLGTSFIIITAGNQLHGTFDFVRLAPNAAELAEQGKSIFLEKKPGAGDLAGALKPVAGPFFSRFIFGCGVLGMTMSTMTMLMLVSGFILMELTRTTPEQPWYKIGMLLPAVGVLGPLVWADYEFYMAVPTSVICFLFLPIAYISFFLLHNSKAYLGDARPEGTKRALWNIGMGAAILIVTAGSLRVVYLKWPALMKLLGLGG